MSEAANGRRRQRYQRRKLGKAVLTKDHNDALDRIAEDGGEEVADHLNGKLPRVAKCNWRMERQVRVLVNESDAYFHGIIKCGSVWACPVCAAVIRSVRAAEVQKIADGWVEQGGSTAMLTLTMRHKAGEPLDVLLRSLQQAYTRLLMRRTWSAQMASLGFAYQIRAVEVTWSYRNGWHPHLHVLLLFRGDVDGRTLHYAGENIEGLWRASLAGLGRRAAVGVGAKLTRGAAGYVAKLQEHDLPVGSEMTRFDLKSGRGTYSVLPFELLDQAATQPRFIEYYLATKGRRAVVFSKGLRELFGLGPATEDESVIDEVESGGLLWHTLSGREYDAIRDDPAALTAILETAEDESTN